MLVFVSRLLLFSVFVLVSYILFVILSGVFLPPALTRNLTYRDDDNGFLKTRIQQADTTKNIDVLCIGSSHAFRDLDPRIFKKNNIRMFNLGSNSQTPIETEYLLSIYLSSFNPKLVIFDAYPLLFESDGVESLIDLLSNTYPDRNTFQLCLKINSIRGYNTFIYSYFRHLFNFKETRVGKLKEGDYTYVSGGYVSTYKISQSITDFTPETYMFTREQRKACKKIISIFHQKGIKYVIVQAPVMLAKYESIKNNQTIDSSLAQYGTYFNFNKILRLNDSCFSDAHHLNQKGVDIYNQKLIEILKATQLLPDRP